MFSRTVRGVFLAMIFAVAGSLANAAQYAAIVIDARNGEVLHSKNADTRLHPASLTKMMTLYVVFEEIRRGRLRLDQMVTISANAASKPPSRIGLKAGQRVSLRTLIRAAAVKSANDAAAALADAVSGSEPEFGKRMTEMARAMGMNNTTFRNASGLTQSGHLSTARDMATLGRRLFFDFPQYYNLFGRKSTVAGNQTVQSTNRRLLNSYEGADGIKTGYTNAAGFNLVSSARRGREHVIVAMFGGTSSSARNAKVMELMDLGFARMPSRVAIVRPGPLNFNRSGGSSSGTTRIASGPVVRSERPVLRNDEGGIDVTRTVSSVAAEIIQADRESQTDDVAKLTAPRPILRPRPEASSFVVASASASAPIVADSLLEMVETAMAEDPSEPAVVETPVAASVPDLPAAANVPEPEPVVVASLTPSVAPVSTAPMVTDTVRPRVRSTAHAATPVVPVASDLSTARVITRTVATGPKEWAVQLGAYRNRGEAERLLLMTALKEMQALEGGERKIETTTLSGVTYYRARFVGLSQDAAENACARLTARAAVCEPIRPGT